MTPKPTPAEPMSAEEIAFLQMLKKRAATKNPLKELNSVAAIVRGLDLDKKGFVTTYFDGYRNCDVAYINKKGIEFLEGLQ